MADAAGMHASACPWLSLCLMSFCGWLWLSSYTLKAAVGACRRKDALQSSCREVWLDACRWAVRHDCSVSAQQQLCHFAWSAWVERQGCLLAVLVSGPSCRRAPRHSMHVWLVTEALRLCCFGLLIWQLLTQLHQPSCCHCTCTDHCIGWPCDVV